MSLIRKHGAVLQAWACLDLVIIRLLANSADNIVIELLLKSPPLHYFVKHKYCKLALCVR